MTPHDRRLALERLRRLARRLEDAARIARSGGNTAASERTAINLGREAAALRWALLQIEPAIETPRQFFEQLDLRR